jgi:hypothetical protein
VESKTASAFVVGELIPPRPRKNRRPAVHAGIGVPFVFATGYGEQVAFPPEFSDAPKLRKPYSIDSLREAVERWTDAPERNR